MMLLSFLPAFLVVSALVLLGMATQEGAPPTTRRVAMVLGYCLWLAIVAIVALAVAWLVLLSCWGSADESCGETGLGLTAVGAVFAALLPAGIHWLTAPSRARRAARRDQYSR